MQHLDENRRQGILGIDWGMRRGEQKIGMGWFSEDRPLLKVIQPNGTIQVRCPDLTWYKFALVMLPESYLWTRCPVQAKAVLGQFSTLFTPRVGKPPLPKHQGQFWCLKYW